MFANILYYKKFLFIVIFLIFFEGKTFYILKISVRTNVSSLAALAPNKLTKCSKIACGYSFQNLLAQDAFDVCPRVNRSKQQIMDDSSLGFSNLEKAPTILFRHQNGPISQSNDGKLIVYPGTTVHMECLWMRRFGNPKWNVSHEYRNYAEGWVTGADEGRDANLEYRLSIYNATENDSGIYTCQTPARHEHSVEILVRAINCPEIPARRGFILSSNNTKLSTRVFVSCLNGNSLIGASELICLPGGNWNAPLPVCESIECGDIPLVKNLTSPSVSILSREVGGRAAFSCTSGYGLRGPTESICMPSGEWALPFPTCIEVQCDVPGAPQNGYTQGSAPYRAGDVVQFNCNPEYMMQGQPIIACQDSGKWSGVLPKCVQACSYPGTAISGRMSSVKFYYSIGESISFTCDGGLELRGSKMLKCLKTGKWSNAIPTCVSSDQINKTAKEA